MPTYVGVRNYYSSCMDKEAIEKSSINDLKEILESLGGWPVLDGESWNEEGFSWWALSEKAAREGLGGRNPGESALTSLENKMMSISRAV